MPTVTKIKWPELNIDYGWVFKLSSFEELIDYWEKVRVNRLKDGFSNYLKSREYHILTGDDDSGKNHITRDDAQLLHGLCVAETMKDSPRSVVDVFADGTSQIFKGMLRVLQDKGHLYVNKVGGYFFLSSGLEETEEQEVKEYVLPGEKVSVKQWPGGKHWYTFVGGTRVIRNGEEKWSSKAMAELNGEKWAKENGIVIEEES